MISDSIFYFVNAEGSGHTRRAEAILRHLSMPTVLHIPHGRDRAYLSRIAAIASLCEQHRCRLAVIDVCVETAMLMRLCGIPYLYMRMSGQRDDAAHRQCYRAALGLIASYPQALEEAWVPDWMRIKTHYGGGIFVPPTHQTLAESMPKPYILVMRGQGMSQLTPSAIAKAARQIPDYSWIGIGFDTPEVGNNWRVLPYVSNPGAYLRQADIVIANTGNNTVLEVGYWQKPLIALPEWRFFDEQAAKAQQLTRHQLAVVAPSWPDTAAQWRSLINQSRQLPVERWSQIVSDSGARRAADYIAQTFEQLKPTVTNTAQPRRPQSLVAG